MYNLEDIINGIEVIRAEEMAADRNSRRSSNMQYEDGEQAYDNAPAGARYRNRTGKIKQAEQPIRRATSNVRISRVSEARE
jgi:hypothetical protein